MLKFANRIIVIFSFIALLACDNIKTDQYPNVILIYADDLGRGLLSHEGQKIIETPHIDNLAMSGVRFENAYGCMFCAPARASLLTGLYPASLNLTDWLPGRRNFSFQKLLNVRINQHLPYGINTLPKMLKL